MKYIIKIFLSFIIFNILCMSANASQANDLPQCIVTSHCVRVDWVVTDAESTFEKINLIIKDTPRTEVVEENEGYIHAEATTKWMHYVDDLEVKITSPKTIQVRSESRVGVGDMGVNQKRVDDLAYRLTTNQIN